MTDVYGINYVFKRIMGNLIISFPKGGHKMKNIIIPSFVMILSLMGLSSSATISGYITAPGGNGIQGIIIDANNIDSSDSTDPNGYYALTVPSGWSGTIMPHRVYWNFVPESRTYSNVLIDQTNQDYNGSKQIICAKLKG